MYVLWDKRLEKKWCILNLYGSAHEDKKEFLWELNVKIPMWLVEILIS
jgi:hypothetical protein